MNNNNTLQTAENEVIDEQEFESKSRSQFENTNPDQNTQRTQNEQPEIWDDPDLHQSDQVDEEGFQLEGTVSSQQQFEVHQEIEGGTHRTR